MGVHVCVALAQPIPGLAETVGTYAYYYCGDDDDDHDAHL